MLGIEIGFMILIFFADLQKLWIASSGKGPTLERAHEVDIEIVTISDRGSGIDHKEVWHGKAVMTLWTFLKTLNEE